MEGSSESVIADQASPLLARLRVDGAARHLT